MRLILRLLVLFTLLYVSGSGVQAQVIQGAIAFGGNLSQVDGDEVVGFRKIGFNTAAIAIIPIKEKWSLSLEASFSQKGAYQKYPREDDPTKSLPYYNLRLNYAEVPVIIHFTDKEFLTIGLGLSYGRLVGVKEHEWNIQTPVTLDGGEYYRGDINGLVDVRIPIYKRLQFNFRYAYSFAKIRKRTYTSISGDSWTRNQYNNILTFRIYYIFNERRPYDQN
jgi:hypothetical protein